jgi:hypothetical protein
MEDIAVKWNQHCFCSEAFFLFNGTYTAFAVHLLLRVNGISTAFIVHFSVLVNGAALLL